MKLRDVASESGVSTASIKFYLREGLLPPGAKKNATTAVYDESHVARLELIQALRQVLDVPLSRIAALTALIDDPATPTLDILAAAQDIGVGGTFAPGTGTVGDRERELVSEMIDRCDWPDQPTRARATVEQMLADMAAGGYLPSEQYLVEVTSILDSLSRIDLAATTLPADVGENVPGGRDRLALRVAVGTFRYSRMLMAILNLGHASHSIRRFGG